MKQREGVVQEACGQAYLGLSSPSLIEAQDHLYPPSLLGSYLGLSSPSLIEAACVLFALFAMAFPIWGYQAPASLKPADDGGTAESPKSYLGLSSPSLIEAQLKQAVGKNPWIPIWGYQAPASLKPLRVQLTPGDGSILSGAIKPQPH